MNTNLTGLALALSILALGVSGYTLLQDRAEPAEVDDKIVALDERLAEAESLIRAQAPSPEDAPSLAGRTPAPTRELISLPSSRDEARAVADTALLGENGEAGEQIRELVDEAVEKKAAQLQRMRNKKPSMDVFAEVLDLTPAERMTAEEEVLRGQREMRALLETPTEDGTVLLDELVDVLAGSIARPEQGKQGWTRLFSRLISERVPGTEETYAERAEGVKESVRASFRRDWREEQYATFEAWDMDPTEVQGIEDSPWEDLEQRVIDRARALGADLPADYEFPDK